jgi:hypothetical protein
VSGQISNCAACVLDGERGSCARFRCYCGHRECWAFDSYYEPEVVTAAAYQERKAARQAADTARRADQKKKRETK